MNQTKNDFEGISFNSFDKSDSLFDDPNDPDSHYFGETDYSTEYFHVNEINIFITQHENVSLLRLNIRSLRSNLYDFRTLLEEIKLFFNIICLTETLLKVNESRYKQCWLIPHF